MKLTVLALTLLIFLGTNVPVFAVVSFEIGNPVLEGDYYIVDAKLSGISSDSAYVQGMFKHPDSSTYFGSTWGQKGEWFAYDGSVTKEYIQQNYPILNKDTTQKIWIRPDFSHSAYKGPGSYLLKLKRYTGNSDGDAGSSNEVTVTLSQTTPTPEPTPTSKPASITTASPTSTNTPTSTPTPTMTTTKTPTPTATKTPTSAPSATVPPTQTLVNLVIPDLIRNPETSPSGTVLSESTPSSSSTIDNPRSTQPFITDKNLFLLGVIIFSLSGGLLYFRLTNH